MTIGRSEKDVNYPKNVLGSQLKDLVKRSIIIKSSKPTYTSMVKGYNKVNMTETYSNNDLATNIN